MTDPQFALYPDPRPPSRDGIDLRWDDCANVIASVSGAALVHADPPWTYRNAGCKGNARDEYDLLTLEGIATHLDAAYDAAADDAYLLCWVTFPTMMEWAPHLLATRWMYKTGGCWGKTQGLGIGHHFRGDAEPLLVLTKGKPRPVRAISSLHLSPRGKHSEKPEEWLAALFRSFAPPGSLVLDVYAGLGPAARACVRTGHRYVGAEIDEDRHRRALGLLAGVR